MPSVREWWGPLLGQRKNVLPGATGELCCFYGFLTGFSMGKKSAKSSVSVNSGESGVSGKTEKKQFALSDWQKAFTADAKGSFATRDRALDTFRALEDFAKKGDAKNWDLSPGKITSYQVHLFLKERALTISARSLQNEASHIRRAARGAGQDTKDLKNGKNGWSSKRLGLEPSSRLGHKAAADLKLYAAVRPTLADDVRAGTILSEAVGLRLKEMVMCGESLPKWAESLRLSQERGADLYLSVWDGAKGGRHRDVFIFPESREKVAAAIQIGLESVAKYGNVINAEDLKSAMSRYSNALSYAGLTGENSGHGLRRAFAQAQFQGYRDRKIDETKALELLCRDLGHGDGRGRWAWNNYIVGGPGGDD